MIKRDKLIEFLEKTIGGEVLEKARAKDDAANGVQILGGEGVKKVALGVSLNEQFLKLAASYGANFCIFHHGLDVRAFKSLLPEYLQKRLKIVFQNEMTIAGYHYALDAHHELGNNALIIKKLKAKVKDPLGEEWGWIGEFDKKKDLHDLGHECQELFDHEVFVVAGGPPEVKRIGVITGAHLPSVEDFWEMKEEGVELLITGETGEWLPHRMLEAGINYFVCGHYATEKFGVQALGETIKDKFKKKIKVKFIDVPNEI